jgi:hypothetical protein
VVDTGVELVEYLALQEAVGLNTREWLLTVRKAQRIYKKNAASLKYA